MTILEYAALAIAALAIGYLIGLRRGIDTGFDQGWDACRGLSSAIRHQPSAISAADTQPLQP
jgi:hypothetical protein